MRTEHSRIRASKAKQETVKSQWVWTEKGISGWLRAGQGWLGRVSDWSKAEKPGGHGSGIFQVHLAPQGPKVKLHFPQAALTVSCHGTKIYRPAVGSQLGGAGRGCFPQALCLLQTASWPCVSSLSLCLPTQCTMVCLCESPGISCVPLGEHLSLCEVRLYGFRLCTYFPSHGMVLLLLLNTGTASLHEHY